MPFNFLNQGQNDDTATRFQPIDTFIDPVSKIRVSNPGNLIDTDFEYGLQPTKWETVEIINNTPAFFSKSGDTTISDITGITTNAGTREITVTTAFPHNLDVGIPIRVAGTKIVTADGSYIINATPTPTTFTYLSRANVDDTVSIFDLYSSIITGEFFQGSQISISDSDGISTDGAGPESTLTVKTSNKHGFGPKTPFYFLNLNSTVSKEFQSQNSTSLSFDPTNSATAQAFDGSNTLLQTPIDLSNSATTATDEDSITNTDPQAGTFTVSIAQNNEARWSNLKFGDPLYYSVNAGGGFFQSNPRGVVFIKEIDGIDVTNATATFEVSEVPNGDAISVLANTTGYFQVADQARTFAGNNVNEQTQTEIQVEINQDFIFDGGNQGYDGNEDTFSGSPPSNQGTVIGYTGTTVNLFTAEGSLDYYVGAMLRYNSDGEDATGLVSDTTYFVTAFAPGQSAGLFTMSVAPLPGGNAINVSGGSGTQLFSKIGVSIDKNIFHIRNSNFEEDDMLEYTFPENGNFGSDFEQKFYFVDTAYDAHNYKLLEDSGFKPMVATGGNSITEVELGGRTYNVHQFSSVGSSTFTVQELGSEATIDVLVVGGGGGGGTHHGGGGGAGGVVYKSNLAVSEAQAFTVTVGAGGAPSIGTSATISPNSQRGGDSTFDTYLARGGGGSYGWSRTSGTNASGGSGAGGQNWVQSAAGGAATQPGTNPDADIDAGFPGDSTNTLEDWGGGGGGAGGAPAGGFYGDSNGGVGINLSDRFGTGFGENGFFGGGGGAGNYRRSPTSQTGIGGQGGGGNGGNSFGGHGSDDTNGGDGLPNTGGGGGGTASYISGKRGGFGGSGVVLVRYPITELPIAGIQATGGNESELTQGNTIFKIHEFSTVGSSTFTVSRIDRPDIATIDVLVVGGGGGGGTHHGGGGGAGGVVYKSKYPVQVDQNFTVTVGAGGAPSVGTSATISPNSERGGDSTFGTYLARGGGGSYGWSRTSGTNVNGGSGAGGQNWVRSAAGGAATQPGTNPDADIDAGFPGDSTNTLEDWGGGGGGAGGAPAGGFYGDSDGGPGRNLSDIFGTGFGEDGWFGGGGGAGNYRRSPTSQTGIGGQGGGGNGGNSFGSHGSDDTNGGDGLPNTGGGGGGTASYISGKRGGFGGSGVVLVRYAIGVVE